MRRPSRLQCDGRLLDPPVGHGGSIPVRTSARRGLHAQGPARRAGAPQAPPLLRDRDLRTAGRHHARKTHGPKTRRLDRGRPSALAAHASGIEHAPHGALTPQTPCRPVGRKTRRHPLGEQVQRGEPPCLGRIFRRHDRRMRPVRLVLETSSLPHKHGLLRLAVRLRLPGLAASRRDLSDVGHHGFGRLARRLREGRLQNALRRAHQKAPRRGHSRPRVLDAGDRHRARPVRTFACRDRSSPITHGPDLSERMEHPGQCISLAFVRPADKKRESPGKRLSQNDAALCLGTRAAIPLARILNETFRKPRSIVQTIKPPKSAEEFGGFR